MDKCCLYCRSSMSKDGYGDSEILVCFNCAGCEGAEVHVTEDEYCENFN